MKSVVVLENLRSAYNVWNIIRTADALGRDVWLVGYTPSPFALQKGKAKVAKTSLWAENHVGLRSFPSSIDALHFGTDLWYVHLAAEITGDAISLDSYISPKPVCLWMGNEVTWVEQETLATVDSVVMIPLRGMKESMNVWQAAAICMWHIGLLAKTS